MTVFLTSIFSLLIYQSHAQNLCGSEVLIWSDPGSKEECAVQHWQNDGLPEGSEITVWDPNFPTSEAKFVCTADGWKVVTAVCGK